MTTTKETFRELRRTNPLAAARFGAEHPEVFTPEPRDPEPAPEPPPEDVAVEDAVLRRYEYVAATSPFAAAQFWQRHASTLTRAQHLERERQGGNQ